MNAKFSHKKTVLRFAFSYDALTKHLTVAEITRCFACQSLKQSLKHAFS